MLDFLHRLLRRIIARESLPEENDWDALLGFDFTGVELLSISKFMEKTEFRTKAMRAAKGRINVEKEKSKKSKTEVSASSVMGDMFNPYVNQGGHIFVMCVVKFQSTRHSNLIWWWGWRALTTLCCLYCPGASYGLLCPTISKLLCSWLVAQRTEKCG